ncbi:MAG: hypothetical protein K8S25_00325 [Alphaproteobacteria bacterium]|nr:hypothetical protein [Alphaproteobacteria bacterium]
MRKIAILGFAALVAAGLSGAALADTMAEAIGNTVLATNAKGETTKLWFKADGTYTFETAKGEKGSGKWAIKEGKYCNTPDLPATAPAGTAAPKETCDVYEANHKAGDKWAQKNASGETFNIEIKKGM